MKSRVVLLCVALVASMLLPVPSVAEVGVVTDSGTFTTVQQSHVLPLFYPSTCSVTISGSASNITIQPSYTTNGGSSTQAVTSINGGVINANGTYSGVVPYVPSQNLNGFTLFQNNVSLSGTVNYSVTCSPTVPVSVVNGGTGTSSPAPSASPPIIQTGTWPNLTYSLSSYTPSVTNVVLAQPTASPSPQPGSFGLTQNGYVGGTMTAGGAIVGGSTLQISTGMATGNSAPSASVDLICGISGTACKFQGAQGFQMNSTSCSGNINTLKNNGTNEFIFDCSGNQTMNGALNLNGTTGNTVTSNSTGATVPFTFNANNVSAPTGDIADFQIGGSTKLQILNGGGVTSQGNFVTGSSTYGATSASINGLITNGLAVTNNYLQWSCAAGSGHCDLAENSGASVSGISGSVFCLNNGTNTSVGSFLCGDTSGNLGVSGKGSFAAHNVCSSSSGWPCETSGTCALSAATTCSFTVTVPATSVCYATGNGSDTTTGVQSWNVNLASTTLTVKVTEASSQTSTAAANIGCL